MADLFFLMGCQKCEWMYSIGKRTVRLRIGLRGQYAINNLHFSMGVRPDKDTVACRGSWRDAKTFVIEHHIIGDPAKQIFTLTFHKKTISLAVATYGRSLTIKGFRILSKR